MIYLFQSFLSFGLCEAFRKEDGRIKVAFDHQEQRSLAYLELREAAGNAGRSGRARTRSEDEEEERLRKKARRG